MHNLQIGDLILVRGTDFISKCIERITQSRYSHVAVYVGGGLLIEAQGKRKVGYQDLSAYEGYYDVYRYIKPLTSGQQATIIYNLQSRIGDEYDYLDILVLFIRYLFHFKIPWHEHKRFICSMLARDALKSAGLDVPDGNVSPEDLAEYPSFVQIK